MLIKKYFCLVYDYAGKAYLRTILKSSKILKQCMAFFFPN